eukprot:TRINITY_DN7334_c0_g1_i1.p1 TRINITY_DN7334_c0_g1~~TRINITY_DN7334_c0_g1_i1.p1  ORF type:complete len:799 (+),score=192.60 TRINITY_DN7334_c0_g1_i1:91-2487(+)
MADNAAKSKKKKKKDKKGDDPSAPSETADGASTTEGSIIQLRILPGVPTKRTAAPLVVVPPRELKRAGLASGDPALLVADSGRCTVAICEPGGREEGVILSATVLQSLGLAAGDSLAALEADFEALEAEEVEIEVPEELRSAWPDLAGSGLQLDRYLAAALESCLLVAGDVRSISFSGKLWRLKVRACRGGGVADTAGDETPSQQSWLLSRKTQLTTFTAEPAGQQPGESSQTQKDDVGGLQEERRGLARVGGLRGVIDELKEAVQMPLERPDLYRKLGIGPPRGVLLYGPPGTGKTLLAKALGEELRCPVELCASTDLVGGGVGEAEDRIKALFERCRKMAADRGTGALVFIDEIDAVCPKRDDSGEAERRMVAAFLVALDGAKGTGDGIVVLGATNRPDAIDPALRRAGRLEREIEVGVPNAEERRQILDVHLSGLRHSLLEEEKKELARRVHGYVGADIRALVMAAARSALRRGVEKVDLASCMEAARSIPPSALKELLVEVPEVRWQHIGGYEGTKESLREAVEWPIRYAWAFEEMAIDPPRGVLLYGPPGCSKTMMAKAVATETEMNFVSIKGPELFSKYVGDSERAVRNVFRKARTAAPCIVFFDEIDAVGASREGESGGGVAARVLTQLLAEMDGIGLASGGSSEGAAKRHVVVLAATNRPQVLDPALMRPGRFDRLVHVPLPDTSARRAIFERQLSKMQVEASVDAGMLADRTHWYSGAEVVMVCREAAMAAIRDVLETRPPGDQTGDASGSQPCATISHFEKALATVRPRIDQETVRFYQDFESKMKHG